ncbi:MULTISPECIES: hypothetical protein [unclassified Curtobacterium]|uniref:hypothetical protein n=1 Tax=unclassified Curtobacterium TaxID=257496 RepID=UPI00203FD244|nr:MULTISPECIES: hypothetical protein [unclassified Curtobacterium]MCM3506025.1 hypothetical protein [Curtobacterium sp. ODYSSEY 48 V2]MCM3521680.1 hypothetical protein [Curtobacterium sp. P97]
MDDSTRLLRLLTPEQSWTAVVDLLGHLGWVRCGTGDWAQAFRSPSGRLAARISPFDPAGPYSAMLYRLAAHTRQVPALVHHRVLDGGADLTVMEYLEPVSVAIGARFHQALAGREPSVAVLADVIDKVHARGAAEQPWWGPLDDNPANVMRGSDGRLVVADLFYADGPVLYAAARTDPDRIARDYPEHRRRHMTELPLASSGGWPPGDAEEIRALLADVDARAAAPR